MVINVPLLKGLKNFMQLAVGDKFPLFDRCRNQKEELMCLDSFTGKPFVFTHLSGLGEIASKLFQETLLDLIPKVPITVVLMFDCRVDIKTFAKEESFVALEDESYHYRDSVFVQYNPERTRAHQPVIVVDSNHSIVYLTEQSLLGEKVVLQEFLEAVESVSSQPKASQAVKSVQDANPKEKV